MEKLQEISIKYTSSLLDSKNIQGSEDAANIFFSFWEDINIQESFAVLAMNKANKPLGIKTMFKGGISSTIVDEKLVFAVLLKSLSSSFIIAHNHPSMNLRPSDADINLTRKLKEVGNFIGITLLDHLILSPDNKYYSFMDEGML